MSLEKAIQNLADAVNALVGAVTSPQVVAARNAAPAAVSTAVATVAETVEISHLADTGKPAAANPVNEEQVAEAVKKLAKLVEPKTNARHGYNAAKGVLSKFSVQKASELKKDQLGACLVALGEEIKRLQSEGCVGEEVKK